MSVPTVKTLFHGATRDLVAIKELVLSLYASANPPCIRLATAGDSCCLLWTRGSASEVADVERQLKTLLRDYSVVYNTKPAALHTGSDGRRMYPLCPFRHPPS